MVILHEIGLKYATDKATTHRYTMIYPIYFEKYRSESIKILEIGVASGKSMKMWYDYFPKAIIYGIDIEENAKQYENERVKIFTGDQGNSDFLNRVCEETGLLNIIIDDGSHFPQDQEISLRTLFPNLISGGMYAIEDINMSYLSTYLNLSWSGGYKVPGTTIEFLKTFVDSINIRFKSCFSSCVLGEHAENNLSYFDENLFSIHFYEGLCFFIKDLNGGKAI